MAVRNWKQDFDQRYKKIMTLVDSNEKENSQLKKKIGIFKTRLTKMEKTMEIKLLSQHELHISEINSKNEIIKKQQKEMESINSRKNVTLYIMKCKDKLIEDLKKEKEDSLNAAEMKRKNEIIEDLKKEILLIKTERNNMLRSVINIRDEQSAFFKENSKALLTAGEENKATVSSKRKVDIPDYLTCKISLDIMTDPVMTPNGITYDRESIEEHLQIGGPFEPCTRAPLTKEQLVPNYALKDALDAFRTQNTWMD